MMEKLVLVVFSSLLIVTLSLAHHPFKESSLFFPSPCMEGHITCRRLLKEQHFSSASKQKPKGFRCTKKPEMKVGSESRERDRGDDDKGLIYSADYRGVSTHPSPLPKHPEP